MEPEKVVVVIEKPEKCEECPLVSFNPFPQSGFKCRITKQTSYEMERYHYILSKCPLRDLPKKWKYAEFTEKAIPPASYKAGWNACIDAMEGGDRR